jgi:N utilization substance protein B
MGESPRRRARELVLKRLYAAEVEENEPEQIIRSIHEDETLSERNREFARQFFLLVRRYQSWADEVIVALAENWRLERVAAVDKIVLRMALVELKYLPDSPAKVAINEAIELAKLYSTAESSAFINGILDRYVRDAEELEKPQ